MTTKIVALVDALGNLVRFVLLPGQRHDTIGVPPLIEGIAFDALLGDKAFDADWLRAELDRRGAAAVIPPKANRKASLDYDKAMYRWRPQGSPHFFCCNISMLAIINLEDDEARRCQGWHCAVKAALLEEFDRVGQVMADKCQLKDNIE